MEPEFWLINSVHWNIFTQFSYHYCTQIHPSLRELAGRSVVKLTYIRVAYWYVAIQLHRMSKFACGTKCLLLLSYCTKSSNHHPWYKTVIVYLSSVESDLNGYTILDILYWSCQKLQLPHLFCNALCGNICTVFMGYYTGSKLNKYQSIALNNCKVIYTFSACLAVYLFRGCCKQSRMWNGLISGHSPT